MDFLRLRQGNILCVYWCGNLSLDRGQVLPYKAVLQYRKVHELGITTQEFKDILDFDNFFL